MRSIRAEFLDADNQLEPGLLVISGATGAGCTSAANAVIGLFESKTNTTASNLFLGADENVLKLLTRGGVTIDEVVVALFGVRVKGTKRPVPGEVLLVHDLHHSPNATRIAQTLKAVVEHNQANGNSKKSTPRVVVTTVGDSSTDIIRQLGSAKIIALAPWTVSESAEYFRSGFTTDNIRADDGAIETLSLFSGQIPRFASRLGRSCCGLVSSTHVSTDEARDSIDEVARDLANRDLQHFDDNELDPFRGSLLNLSTAMNHCPPTSKSTVVATAKKMVESGVANRTGSKHYEFRSGLHSLALWLRTEEALTSLQGKACRYRAHWEGVRRELRKLLL